MPGRSGLFAVLRIAALIAAVAGAAGSLAFMLRVGHRNKSVVLLGLFTIWVLSPFVGVIWANLVSKRWPVGTTIPFYVVMVVIALGSVAIYGEVALGPPRAQPAAAFLMVPLVSWLPIGTVWLFQRHYLRGT